MAIAAWRRLGRKRADGKGAPTKARSLAAGGAQRCPGGDGGGGLLLCDVADGGAGALDRHDDVRDRRWGALNRRLSLHLRMLRSLQRPQPPLSSSGMDWSLREEARSSAEAAASLLAVSASPV
ncbi:hypothetical protein E2562_010218 [Oryza meyeriana var. granulata]|uniref:Uncharacterized protein n=1 Tax=Oryza meyeriana var. granulata TaxID=110450 RepID=A0A6G1EKX7_9ORYZ|nr:hypothetical protein E2562_010218 [Oryza meyeriana var. granulata]